MSEGGPRSLEVVQRWFQAVVSHPDGVEGGAVSPDAQELIRLDRGELEAVVRRSRNLTASERLSIYANAYYSRLLECLGGCFPVLKQALGDDVFDSFAFEYLQRYPSRSYTLDHLGKDFPRFLDETRPGREEGEDSEGVDWPDFLIDLATFEWTVAKVFDGPGVEGQALLTPEALQSFPPERFAEARLVPVPCLKLLAFRFPVNAYYTAARHAEEGEEVPVPEPAAEQVAITRREFVVRRYPLSPPQHALLTEILAGATVGEAITAAAGASELDDEALAAELRAWFRFWVAEGFFVSVAS
ncbi:MAG TPA: DNA-binding domain-containing protein [Thermoanaerobaculia bacterium]|nr:DNA-binding domain-containing protein [Thermoanaerobaculia bacterium]